MLKQLLLYDLISIYLSEPMHMEMEFVGHLQYLVNFISLNQRSFKILRAVSHHPYFRNKILYMLELLLAHC